jgi:hypothetical protein
VREAATFDAWLTETMERCTSSERARRLLRVEAEAPHFRACHPREEHFTPIYVALGAASPELDGAALSRSLPEAQVVTQDVGATGDVAARSLASNASTSSPPAVATRRVIDHPMVLGSMSVGSWILQ